MNILIFVASLPYSKPAISFGGKIAKLTDSRVTLLSAGIYQKDRDKSETLLTDAKALLHDDVEVETRFHAAPPAKAVLQEVEAENYDLVVVRARKAIRYRQRLRGKVGRTIANEAPIPVLIIKQKRATLKRILICTGGTHYANKVIEMGAELARAAQAEVTLLHITNAVPTMYTGLDAVEETLPELLQTQTLIAQHLRDAAELLDSHNVKAQLEIRRGEVATELLQEADEGNYDLIIIGATRGALRSWFLGSVTREIVNHAKCPVLVVRGPYPGGE